MDVMTVKQMDIWKVMIWVCLGSVCLLGLGLNEAKQREWLYSEGIDEIWVGISQKLKATESENTGGGINRFREGRVSSC